MATAVWVDDGQEQAIDLLNTATRGAVSTTYYGAWGSGATAAAVTDAALVSENAEARVATTESQPAANTWRNVFEITATGNRTVNEAGIFDASSTGTLILRGTHSTLNIETSDRVEYTFDLLLKDQSE
ncbi:MAG: hypothetical protein CMN85_10575 [Spongiibacteraceae bacterium]|nr:hypothetical protein [Spongiibacteraceae bacterium]|tara:strand:+ start:13599 stop:13982 length:384 start_codon:yes stop_codon:yes gene_type:complete